MTSFEAITSSDHGIREITLVPGFQWNLKGIFLFSFNAIVPLDGRQPLRQVHPVIGGFGRSKSRDGFQFSDAHVSARWLSTLSPSTRFDRSKCAKLLLPALVLVALIVACQNKTPNSPSGVGPGEVTVDL